MTTVRGQDQCMGFGCQSMKLFEGRRRGGGKVQEAGARKCVRAKLT